MGQLGRGTRIRFPLDPGRAFAREPADLSRFETRGPFQSRSIQDQRRGPLEYHAAGVEFLQDIPQFGEREQGKRGRGQISDAGGASVGRSSSYHAVVAGVPDDFHAARKPLLGQSWRTCSTFSGHRFGHRATFGATGGT